MALLSPIAVANQTIGCSFHGGLKPREKDWLVMKLEILHTNFRPIEIVMLLVIRRELVESRKEKVVQETGKSESGHHFILRGSGCKRAVREASLKLATDPPNAEIRVASFESSQLQEKRG